MTRLLGWRPALRIAWREVRRARGRSALLLAMIAIPVLAVTAAAVLLATQRVDRVEGTDRTIGAADALLEPQTARWVEQMPDPSQCCGQTSAAVRAQPATLPDIERVLGRPVDAQPMAHGDATVITERGAVDAGVLLVDLTTPQARPLFTIVQGRPPAGVGEVVINRALADTGFAVGDELTLRDRDVALEVVGIGEHSANRSAPMLVGLPGSAPEDSAPTWLVSTAGGVSWPEVRALNEIGVQVTSRRVLTDPPADSEVPALAAVGPNAEGSRDLLAIVALIVTMAVLEVVLLAGPAFAVGARRQSRTLALMAASGGTPAQARRTVLASGVVLGALASVLGAVAGIGLAAGLAPLLQRMSGSWFGPFEVPIPQVLAIAGFGLLSALLAAIVPAVIAARQDVVAVLAGRRGDRRPGARSPLVGLVLLGVGILGAGLGAKGDADSAALLIAGSSVLSVLGMILVVPVVVSVLSRLAGRFPLPLRYAARDAARHRTRTVPAVAAVAATVAGVVALGIANQSDSAEARATYTPVAASGVGLLTAWEAGPGQWSAFAAAIAQEMPGARVTPLSGFAQEDDSGLTFGFSEPGARGEEFLLDQSGMSLGSDVLVGERLPEAIVGVSDDDRGAAEATLARGGVVVFTNREVAAAEVRATVQAHDFTTGRPTSAKVRSRLAAAYVRVPQLSIPPLAVLSPAAASTLGVTPQTVGLQVTGEISRDQEAATNERIAGLDRSAEFTVERGYRSDDANRILLLVLFGLGAVLVLGGTLTATFLALSDARPDLATLSAIGATPRTRRGVAGSYALVVGFVGALLGAAVGFIPGVAITYPLTSGGWRPDGLDIPAHFLDIPWTLIAGLVLGLPVLTAAVVGLAARSRLPLVARLD